MENELRKILLDTACAFAKASDCAVSTVSRRVKNNPNFFSRIEDTTTSFTLRTYDEVMRWFASNWPEKKQLPLGLMKWMVDTSYTKDEVSA
jgi:hypothetical protein